jgi:hypothetical protein
MGLSDNALATVLAETADLGRFQAALVRERVIRNTMAQTGEGRTTVVDMINALDSMDQEAVLDLTEGEPTTLVDALRRYVAELEKRDPDGDELTPVARITGDLGALLAYPWPDEEALVSLHDPHYGMALHFTDGEDGDLEIRMGSNRHLVYTAKSGIQGWEAVEARRVAEAVYRATLVRVIPDRDHHVQLNSSDRAALVAWLEQPNGSIWMGRLTLDAAGSGVIVRTRARADQGAARGAQNQAMNRA